MARYILKRIFLLVPVLLGVLVVVFVILHCFTTDPAAMMLGQHATTQQIEALRHELGLDQPVYVQFGTYLWQILHGDFGKSLMTGSSVLSEVGCRFPATIELALVAIIFATLFGIVMGVVAAVRQNSIWDYLTMFASLLGVSMPIFWLGLLLIILFSVILGWLPPAGRIDIGLEPAHLTGLYLLDSIITQNWAAFGSAFKHLILPGIALASYSTAIIARMTRSTMLEVVRQDYIRTAKAKGLAKSKVIYRHSLRNALIPVITVIGLQMGALLGGAVLTETVFSWPGLGSRVVDAIMAGDYPMVQGSVIMIATIFVLVNLLVDIFYAFLDPRIHYS